MDTPPPDGCTSRPADKTDAETLHRLVTAYNRVVVGMDDYGLDDARDELAEPGFDLAGDTRLVFAADGEPVGYAALSRQGENHADVDLVTRDPEVLRWLFDWVFARAAGLKSLDLYPYDVDTAMREAALARGFAHATSYHRMRIDHSGPVAAPDPVPGLVLRPAVTEEVRVLAHRVLQDSFSDHFGFLSKPYDKWKALLENQSSFRWELLLLAELDGVPVAVLERNDRYALKEGCGYVSRVGVLAAARGRGLARHLLRLAFHLDTAAGLTGTVLHVDSNNTTSALDLYLSVGMRKVLAYDIFRRDL